MKGKTAGKIIALFAVAGMLAGCGGKTGTTPDDYATNDGYITTETAGNSTGVHSRIPHRARQEFRKKI